MVGSELLANRRNPIDDGAYHTSELVAVRWLPRERRRKLDNERAIHREW